MNSALRLYGVNTGDGFAQDFEAESDDAAEIEARRILVEEQAKPLNTYFEIWASESDVLVRDGRL